MQKEYLQFLSYCLKNRQFKMIDLDHIQNIFKDKLSLNLRHSQEMIREVYPILKLILRFYEESTQKNYSYKMIVNKKLNQALQSINRKSARDFEYEAEHNFQKFKPNQNGKFGQQQHSSTSVDKDSE